MNSGRDTVLLVGASGGIGLAVSQRLAQEGYAVIGIDKELPAIDSHLSAFFNVDLTDERQTEATYQDLLNECAKFWGLVHCSGIYPIVNTGQYTLKLWDEVHAVNVRSIFQMAQQLIPHVQPGGRVVLVASGAAHVGSRDIGYSSSKAGALGLVRSLAKTLAPAEILVNAVAPGVIQTKMSARMSREHVAEYLSRIPLGRSGTPDEVAVCISFLLDKANSYMTGATIDVTGGLYSR